MKYFFYLCISIFTAISTISAAPSLTLQQVDHLTLYCKVWGFLKYYHPAIADHNLNWDSTFIKYYDKAKSASTKEEFNTTIYSLYQEAEHSRDDVKHKAIPSAPPNATYVAIATEDWMDTPYFTNDIIQILHTIKREFLPQDNYFVKPTNGIPYLNPDFTNDSLWVSMQFPIESIRVLALSRYWNIINYFYPYKEGLLWDTVLHFYIPKIIHSTDTLFDLEMIALCNEIRDSHSSTVTRATIGYFGLSYLPLKLSYIEGKTVITSAYPLSQSDSILKSLGLEKGDVIEKINGENVDSFKMRFKRYIPYSNEAVMQNILCRYVAITKAGKSAILTIDDGKNIRDISLKYISYFDTPTSKDVIPSEKSWRLLPSNIGYINMDKLMPQQIDTAIFELLETRAIIFDIRGYPNGTGWHLMDYLSEVKTPIFNTCPMITKPGYLIKSGVPSLAIEVGDRKLYRGKILLLVNETTQSQAEFTVMMLQSIEDSKTFGSQTSGADGNVSLIYLPGLIATKMSGLGIYYADGTPTQRIGIKIDYPVKPTIKGIRTGSDEVLEAAINYLH